MQPNRDSGPTIGFALAIFICGVLVPAFVAVLRFLRIGLQNLSSTGHAYPTGDIYLWCTAVVLTAATFAIAALIAREARHGHVLTSGVVLGLLGAAAAWTNWYALLG